MSTKHFTMRSKAKTSRTYRLAKRNVPNVSMTNIPADCRASSTPCRLTNTTAPHVAVKSMRTSGSLIRPVDPDNHAIKQGMKVAISSRRYGDKRNGPRWILTGTASKKMNIGISGDTLSRCVRGAATRPRVEGDDLPISPDVLVAMVAPCLHPLHDCWTGGEAVRPALYLVKGNRRFIDKPVRTPAATRAGVARSRSRRRVPRQTGRCVEPASRRGRPARAD